MQKRPSEPKDIKFCRLNLPPEFSILMMQEDKWYSSFQAITMVHFHNCLQIGYCESGQGYYLINGVLYPYERESISLIPAKALHVCTSQANVVSRWKWLYLDPTKLLAHLNPVYARVLMSILYGQLKIPYVVSLAQNPQVVQIVRCIIREMEDEAAHYKETVQALVQALVLLLVRMADGEPLKEPEGNHRGLQLITPAIEQISMHYMDALTVPQLAQLCYVSPSHLRRMFHKIMNCSPLEYLQLTRMEAACALLIHTSQSVLEIGSQVGFPTESSFTRQFKKIFGTTPGQWRIKMTEK